MTSSQKRVPLQTPAATPPSGEAAQRIEKTHQEASKLHPPSGPVPPPLRRDRHSSDPGAVADIPHAAQRGEK
jgi:hypothetical protein